MNLARKAPAQPLPRRLGRELRRDWQIYVLLLPAVAYFIVFHYIPMYGIQIAFKDYMIVKGIRGSAWVGLKHFQTFFSSHYFTRLLSNTFLLNVYGLIWGFPIPVVLAIFLMQVSRRTRQLTQTLIYVPHFISTVVLAGMLYLLLSPTSGLMNKLIVACGGQPVYFLAQASWFRTVFIASGIWQNAGWGSILYIAALMGVDPELYEAATIDGASRLQKIRYIDLPSILPIVTIQLILSCGRMLGSNTQKVLLLQTAGNMATSDVIGVYVYNMGLAGGQFSYTAAIGLFLNVINFVIILLVNALAGRVGETSLF